jgi:phosphotransferase system enzyme I (PtsI)
MAELQITGTPASAGLAAGVVFLLADGERRERRRGGARLEAAALEHAVARARDELALLAASLVDDGAEILAFQIAMLEDDALAEPAFADIAAGAAADAAWRAALAAQIADYEGAEDAIFRARASDLVDIRDRVLNVLSGDAADLEIPPGAILVGKDLTPSAFLAIDWTAGGGVALTAGSASSHVATLARARGVPMIVGFAFDLDSAAGVGEALIDAESGTLWLDPDPATRVAFATRRERARRASQAADDYRMRPAITGCGTPVAIYLNISDPAELDALDPASCDGIGLARTEFLFDRRDGWPDEEQQFGVYRRLVEWAAGKPVTIRTLDAGADKPIPGMTVEGETNPFLGLRGIRLSLAKPDVFRAQLRALARAAARGDLEVMLPMVALPSELATARSLLMEEVSALKAAGVECRAPRLGIMVEVPAAAIAVEDFDAEFYSIGSNDLTQYVMAAARDNPSLAALSDPVNPAVLKLIAHVAAHGAATGRKVSLCGDAGGEPRHIEALLTTGLRALSVAPSALARAKQAIARVRLDGGDR